MLCTNYYDVDRSLMAMPLKTAHAVESYCALLTTPQCLYGMYDVAKALASLHAFCTRKVLSTSTPEQYRMVLMLATRDILEPIVDLLWCRLVAKHDGKLGQVPADFAQRLKDLESHLSQPMIENMWQLRRACEEAVDDVAGSHQLEKLLTALQRLRDLFQDVSEVMSPGERLQASVSLEPIRLPDYCISCSAPHTKTTLESNNYKWSGPQSPSHMYSLFGGQDSWPFGSAQVDAIINDDGQRSPSSFCPTSPPSTMHASSSYPTLPNFGMYAQSRPNQRIDQRSPASLRSETQSLSIPEPTLCAVSLEGKENPRYIGSEIALMPFCKVGRPFTNQGEHDLASLMSLNLSVSNGAVDSTDWQESPIRYKTAMCKRVVDGQKCRYSKACGFAHSEVEKDRYTRLHLATTRCTFGPKCHNPSCGRAHTAQEQHLAIKIYNRAVDRGRGAPPKQ